jgi:quercetin dioxygenase-like cupin family protein
MTTADPRYIAPTEGFFTTRDAIAPERLGAVEGVRPKGRVEVRRVMVGQEILMLHVFREKGLIDPVHKHDDHETVAYLLRGKLRLVIGGKEFIAGPGTSWIHPRGVEHFSEALEDCEQLEIKSPPKKTWVTEE